VPLTDAEFTILRQTIGYRGTVRMVLLPVTLIGWAAIVLVILGWRLARDIGRSLAPPLFARMDEATAGTVGFLIRLVFLI